MIQLKDEHYYSAIMLENGKTEFVVFEYKSSTYHLTGQEPFSLDQRDVVFENIKPLGSKELLAREG